MNITKDLKKLVNKEEDINLKNKKTDILDSLDLTYSLQKEEYKYTPLLKNVEKKFDLLKENKMKVQERDLSLVEFINADLVFATGTNGEITPVTEMDGREIKCNMKFLEKIKNLFESKLSSLCEPL